jgi:hypothetical protein
MTVTAEHLVLALTLVVCVVVCGTLVYQNRRAEALPARPGPWGYLAVGTVLLLVAASVGLLSQSLLSGMEASAEESRNAEPELEDEARPKQTPGAVLTSATQPQEEDAGVSDVVDRQRYEQLLRAASATEALNREYASLLKKYQQQINQLQAELQHNQARKIRQDQAMNSLVDDVARAESRLEELAAEVRSREQFERQLRQELAALQREKVMDRQQPTQKTSAVHHSQKQKSIIRANSTGSTTSSGLDDSGWYSVAGTTTRRPDAEPVYLPSLPPMTEFGQPTTFPYYVK